MAMSPSSQRAAQPALSGDKMFELLLFRLGEVQNSQRRESFGINIFKVREIVVNPPITKMANAPAFLAGVANIRGQLIPVIDLPKVVGCTSRSTNGLVLVTEFARTTQAFMVDEVDEIVRLDWKRLLPADGSGGGLVSGIAHLDGDGKEARMAQVLDVERILRDVLPGTAAPRSALPRVQLPAGAAILFVDDSSVARSLIEEELKAMGLAYMVARNGKEAWERLAQVHAAAAEKGQRTRDRVALVLTDLEMPEMDGFTLTRNIKQDPRYFGIPVIVHSSLTGSATEGHADSVGADAYVAKFEPQELGASIQKTLALHGH